MTPQMRRHFCSGAPKGIRTPVAGLKGLSPRPLDDRGTQLVGVKQCRPRTCDSIAGAMGPVKFCRPTDKS